MTDPEILKAAILKTQYLPNDLRGIPFERFDIQCGPYRVHWNLRITEIECKGLLETSIYGIIFSHDFAKAFWGTEPRMMYTTGTGDVSLGSVTVDGGEAWKAHLQMLAITPEAERLKYIEKFL